MRMSQVGVETVGIGAHASHVIIHFNGFVCMKVTSSLVIWFLLINWMFVDWVDPQP